MKVAQSFCALILCATLVHAAPLELKLEGWWELTESGIINAIGDKAEILFVKTPFQTESGQPLYLVQGTLGDFQLWGASVEIYGGKNYIFWWQLRGERFDGEANLILNISEEELSLGGDYEQFEAARMRRIIKES
jgi:hypothetical protein